MSFIAYKIWRTKYPCIIILFKFISFCKPPWVFVRIYVEAHSVPWQCFSLLNVLKEKVSSGYLCKWLLIFNKLHPDGTCQSIPLPQSQHWPVCCVSQLIQKGTANYCEFSICHSLNFLHSLNKCNVCSFAFNSIQLWAQSLSRCQPYMIFHECINKGYIEL